jgi:predicted phosphodiesterase
MAAPVLRIFSDLHYRDGQSSFQRLDSFAPLLAGADHVILNGDTVDTQSSAAVPLLADARAFFARHAPIVTFLSGNHDPDISGQTELSLQGGSVWVTHGDVFFDDIAPWSSLRNEMVRRLEQLAKDNSQAGPDMVETRLRHHRVACHALPQIHDQFDRSLITRAVRIVNALIPPRRLLKMLDVWRTTPALARHLALAERPRSRVVVLGHTHYPGVWRHHAGPIVINTGSFCRPFGGQFVELCDGNLRVVRIVLKRGEFHPGRIVAEFPVPTC